MVKSKLLSMGMSDLLNNTDQIDTLLDTTG